MANNFIIFLGGHDAEMCEIKKILQENRIRFYDKNLQWGARLSDYKKELNALNPQDKPVLVELSIDIPLPRNCIVIDHHSEKAGRGKPTSIEQVAEILGIELNRRQKLIAANDRAHIKGLIEAGATQEEIAEIRTFDRRCQGVTDEEERQAEEICKDFKSYDRLDILEIPFKHTSTITDRLFGKYQNLLLITPEMINFFGDGRIAQKLGKAFKASWYGGNLPEDGFWGIKKSKVITTNKILSYLKKQKGF